MIGRIWKYWWNILGDIKLTFYLLIGSVALFITGGLYIKFNYPLFNQLNEMRIQNWMLNNFVDNIAVAWWLPVMIIVLVLLGVNTFICSFNRLSALFPKKKEDSIYSFAYKLTPSLIHCLFIVVMAGHAVTFIAGSWQRTPLAEKTAIETQGMKFNVQSVNMEYYPADSKLRDRISQVHVLMQDNNGKAIDISYLDWQCYNGYHLHLDMEKKKKQPVVKLDSNIEQCNQAHVYHTQKPDADNADRNLMLLVIYDPGLLMIITGFMMILALMVWYYAAQSFGKKIT